MKYQYPSGKIVSYEELWELWQRCNPQYKHNKVEFAMSLYVDIKNGTLRQINDEIPTLDGGRQ